MSKICGIIGPGLSKEGLEAPLREMTRAMKHQPWHRIDQWRDPNAGLGHLSIEAVNEQIQPLFSADGSKAVIFTGKIFGYEESRNELLKKGYKFRFTDNDAEYVLNLYEESGSDKFRELNGIFAFCIWDRKKRELILVNDRYGMRPMYYHFNDKNKVFVFGSELKAVSHSRFYEKRVNWDGWNVFLRLGFFVDEDTFFKDVYFMPQGSIIKFDLERIKILNYWNYNELPRKETFDEKNDVDNLVYLFKRAVKRRIIPGKKVAVFLSGGPDSSGISAELKRQNVDFVSYTTRKFIRTDEDRKSASYVAKLLSIENRFCDLPDNFLERYEPMKNHLLDYQSHEHAWLLPLLERIPLDTKINYDGIGFDFICDTVMYTDSHSPWREMIRKGKHEDFIKNWYYSREGYYNLLWPITQDKYNLAFLSKTVKKKFSSEVFIEKLKAQLARVSNSHAPYVLFHLITRARRSVATSVFQIVSSRLESFCPYMDNELFDYLMSLPEYARFNKTLRSKILSRMYPELFRSDSCFYPANNPNYIEQHEGVGRRRAINLSKKAALFFFSFRGDIFSASYLLPRLAKNILFSNMYALSRSGAKKAAYFRRLHLGLIPQLYMFNEWLCREGIMADHE
ncbi:MAG: asparagine synthetase B [Candidatus Omnitrophica bacterium]|nr:asparagine synthetase B [Candidatus Omnitrophota bacterium]MDD5553453.1 asparagine synthetase B [Candidatus Omnitrophota bacterium]